MLIHIGRENVSFDVKREELTNDVILLKDFAAHYYLIPTNNGHRYSWAPLVRTLRSSKQPIVND